MEFILDEYMEFILDKYMEFTHKGWFGFCPVYFGNLGSDHPAVLARKNVFTPLMICSESIFRFMFFILGTINPEYEPMWPLRITGKLDKPFIKDIRSHSK